jgi:hypothetical protein
MLNSSAYCLCADKVAVVKVGGMFLMSSAYCLCADKVAVGAGDCLIRVWTLSGAAASQNMQTYWQGIKAKVTAVSINSFCVAKFIVVLCSECSSKLVAFTKAS